MKLATMDKEKGNIALTTVTIFIAFTILSVSFLRIATPTYTYSPMVLSEKVEAESNVKIDYQLAYPGKVGPDNPLWYAKAIRDRVWYTLTFNKDKKAELYLLFSDKRLNSSIELFKNNKPDLGLITLTKAEKYLELAELGMAEDTELYKKIGLSSLKHREVIENEILPITPEDLRPQVIKTLSYSKETYTKVKEHMLSKGMVPPTNPFDSN
ncbi:MAG: DUF5667 domain-containing protein [Microgenomates group bacterium]